MKRVYAFAVSLLFGCQQLALAADVSKATIYYVSWFSMTRSALSIEKVRAHYDARIEIVDDGLARNFARFVRDRKVERTAAESHPDVRLVIDLQMDDGTTQTWFADRTRLYSPGGLSSAPIDRAFRLQFEFGGDDLESKRSEPASAR